MVVASCGDLGADADPGVGDLYELALTPDPDPFVAGAAALEILLLDVEAGAPVAGADVTIEPWMTAHGHGISEPPVVTELGDGLYDATWEFSMPGAWELTFSIDGRGQKTSAPAPDCWTNTRL